MVSYVSMGMSSHGYGGLRSCYRPLIISFMVLSAVGQIYVQILGVIEEYINIYFFIDETFLLVVHNMKYTKNLVT